MDNDTKKCPFCGEEIKITAKKCKHCKNSYQKYKVLQAQKLVHIVVVKLLLLRKNVNTVVNGWLKKKLRDLHLYRVLNDANSAVQLFLNMQKDVRNAENG